jgi:hypothetical protein
MDKPERAIINQKVSQNPNHRQDIHQPPHKYRKIANIIRSSSGVVQIVVIIAAIIVVLGAAGGVSAYYLVNRTLSHPHEDTAKLMSPDTSLYFSLNLRPGAGQLAKFRGVLSKFMGQPSFEDKFDEHMDDLQNEIGIDLKSEVFPWLGPEVALGVTDIGKEPKVLVLVGTTDKEASQRVFDKWLDYREKSLDAEPGEDSYLDIPIYNIESPYGRGTGEHYALTDDYIVFSNSIELLKDTIDMMKSPGDSLADKDDFQTARHSVQDERVAFFYMDTDEIYQQAQSALGLPLGGLLAGLGTQMPETAAMSASFRDDGFQMDFVTHIPAGSEMMSGSEQTRSARLLPSDTLALFNIGNFESFWEQVTNALKSQEGLLGQFEEGLSEFEESSGYNLERDIFSWMSGEITIALLPSQIAMGEHGGIQGKFEAVALIESSDIKATEDFLQDVERDLARLGVELDRQSVEGHDVTFVRGDFPGSGYSMGYSILGDFLVIGITKDAIATVIDVYDGNGVSLANDSVYRQIRDDLAGSTVGMFYINAAGVKDMILGLLEPSDRETYNNDVAPFIEPLERLVMDWSTTANENRQTLIITIK